MFTCPSSSRQGAEHRISVSHRCLTFRHPREGKWHHSPESSGMILPAVHRQVQDYTRGSIKKYLSTDSNQPNVVAVQTIRRPVIPFVYCLEQANGWIAELESRTDATLHVNNNSVNNKSSKFHSRPRGYAESSRFKIAELWGAVLANLNWGKLFIPSS